MYSFHMRPYQQGYRAGQAHIVLFGLANAIDNEPTVWGDDPDTRLYFTGWRGSVITAVNSSFDTLMEPFAALPEFQEFHA